LVFLRRGAGGLYPKVFQHLKDFETLVPFIKSALKISAGSEALGLRLEPSDLDEYNKHYAGRMSDPGMPLNGLRPDQVAKEGSDQFF
jgi:glucosylceramidase